MFVEQFFFLTGETRQNRKQQAVPGDTHTQHTERGDRSRSHTFGHTVRQSDQRARAERQKSGEADLKLNFFAISMASIPLVSS